ncbi:MAG: carboxypeptidase-like regulatory domain-containing protein [Bacteroidota bacterium]
MKKQIFLLLFTGTLLVPNTIQAQYTQTLRGVVRDKVSKVTLPGASVILLDSGKLIGTATNAEGAFRLEKVAVGRHQVKISFIGYHDLILPVILASGKETVMDCDLEESFITTKEVTISAGKEKDQTNNEMTTVSARMFTIDETMRYAGSRGDPARMAINFAGVSGANDSRNDIIIRGNSPNGLLFRFEDIDIPNPNHFASLGSSGGPVSILNNNVLSNSDFLTGAFPAEYGNALSGVFDLKMRNGNNEKHEYLGQVGFNGFELGAEGPFSKNHKSSYLFNARYSTLELVQNVGFNLGTSGTPRYKDASFKINFPLKNGVLSVFGLAGTSDIAMLDSKREGEDMYAYDGTDLYNGSDLAVSAVSYTRFLNSRSWLKFILAGYYEAGRTRIDTLDEGGSPHDYFRDRYSNYRLSAYAIHSIKIGKNISVRSGITGERTAYDVIDKFYDTSLGEFVQQGDLHRNLANGPTLMKAYSQFTIRLSPKLTFNPGIHTLWYDLNNSTSIEPRAGLSWQAAAKHRFSLAYGMHSRTQTVYAYFIQTRLDDGSYIETNTDLGLTKAQHIIAAYDWNLAENLRLKTEVYYQYVYNVPVDWISSSYSTLNSGATWGSDAGDSLVNKGTGFNRGVELTLEKFFSKNYYFLITASLFESKYKGSDGIERNTAFNNNYVLNSLFGKEFKMGKKRTLVMDVKGTWSGGARYTPVNIAQSQINGFTYYDMSQAFAKQFPDYLKIDLNIGLRTNGKKISQEMTLSIENITNHKNVLMQNYSRSKNEVVTVYQLGFFPMMYYKINF